MLIFVFVSVLIASSTALSYSYEYEVRFSVHPENRTCRMNSKEYKQNERWLDSDCSRIYKCLDGDAEVKDYVCPYGSRCKHGMCQCKNLLATEERDDDSILTRCQEKKGMRRKNRGSKSCRICGKRYKHGQKWLSSKCSHIYQCYKGRVGAGHYACPEHSQCKRGTCRCDRGYKVDQRDGGLIKSCKPRNRSCRYKRKEYKNKSVWLNADCSKKFTCESGEVKDISYECPENSECRLGGSCVCQRRSRPSRFPNGLLKECRLPKRLHCRKGFKSFQGKCLYIKKNSKLSYYEAKSKCKDMGGRLLVPSDLFGFYQKLYRSMKAKGSRCFIGGAPEMAEKKWNHIKGRTTRKFIYSTMKKFKCSSSERYKTFRRLSGSPSSDELNYRSLMKGYCLIFDFKREKTPGTEKCDMKMGYVCEQVPISDPKVRWTEWFNINKDMQAGDEESIYKVIRQLNKDPDNKIRVCRKPLAMECRDSSTKVYYRKGYTHGYNLRKTCEDNRISCLNRKQEEGKICPDFEVRFKCPVDEADTCKTEEVANACKRRGMKCVDSCTGAICVKKRKQKNNKEKINTAFCTYDSIEYELRLCKASGDPHYCTADGYRYNFMGECTYNFLATSYSYQGSEDFPSFSIAVTNYRRESSKSVSWTKSFQLTIGLTTYIFTQGKLLISRKPHGFTVEATAVGFSNQDLTITVECKGNSNRWLIETFFCLRIVWDNKHALFVYIPTPYMNKVTGLCGNFDDESENDLIDPNTHNRLTPKQIGELFLLPGLGDERCTISVPVPVPCSFEDIDKYKEPYYCGVFDTNGASPLVEAVFNGSDSSSYTGNSNSLQSELKECIEDLCWDKDTDRCHDLEDAVEEIINRLYLYDPYIDHAWRKFANCERTEATRCAERTEMIYSPRYIAACQNTCYEPDKADNCQTEEISSGCICKENYYLNSNSECVTLDMCDLSCTLYKENGDVIQMEDGDSHVVIPCQSIARCTRGVVTEEILKPCSENAECINYGTTCQCRKGYTGDGHECKSDKICHQGYIASGDKCYKYVMRRKHWHAAAIHCGAEGAYLARYDDEADAGLVAFLKGLRIHEPVQRREIFCGPGSLCLMPYGFIGIQIRLKYGSASTICDGNFKIAENGKSIVVQGNCRAKFVVTLIKEVHDNGKRGHSGSWMGGNSHVISQAKRIENDPFNVDPPRMVEMSSYQNPFGCFQAILNEMDDLIVYPERDCNQKKPFICEYDNTEPLPHDTDLFDFKVIKEKATFEDAIQLCKAINRPLINIKSQQEHEKVHGILDQVGEHGWIGGRYNAELEDFVWIDHTPMEYTVWAEGEPDNTYLTTGHEHCVSMDREKGEWSSDNCNELFYPICGLPNDIEAPEYTKYFDISHIDSFDELLHKVKNDGELNSLCLRPYIIECSARNSDTGNWVTNFDQTGDTLLCSLHTFRCRENEGLNCESFRVRFLCPLEINQCDEFVDLNVNPCKDGQLCFPVPKHYVCRCPHNRRYNEYTQSCGRKCGICRAWGDPHYTGFFGTRFDFMGDCMYKFAGMCPLPEFETAPNFDIYTKNKLCGTRHASCIDFIEIHLRNMHVILGGSEIKKNYVIKAHRRTDRFWLNGKEDCQRYLDIKGVFQLKRGYDSLSLYVDSLGLTVKFLGRELIVDVSPMFNTKLCGLCGDCSTEQYRLKNLTLVTIPKAKPGKFDRNAIIPVANEWVVPYEGYETDEALAHCKVVEPLDECTDELKAKLEGRDLCGVYKEDTCSINACFSEVDPTEYYENCIIDACHANAEESVCNSLKAYAEACMEKGVYLNWRRNDFCKYECKDKIYRHIASCQPTCGKETLTGNSCDEEPEEGCVCPDGLMRSGDDCVAPDKCGCTVELSNDVDSWYIPPGEYVLVPGCLGKLFCTILEDGSSETIYEPFYLDPNAECKDGPPPFYECADGYVMEDDNITCRKLPKECGRGYVNKADMCIEEDDREMIWRHAIHACNSKDGTLVLIDTHEKVSELKKIMEDGNYDQVFISGQVVASVNEHNQTVFEPVIDQQLSVTIMYRNFHASLPEGIEIVLTDTMTVEDLREGSINLAVVAQLEEDGSISFIAVPRDVPSNFICEEREVPEEDKTWYGPCNSDNMMNDGDKETKDSLMSADCLVCPVASEIRCEKVEGASGTATGECRITKSGTYYYCEEGADCIDHQIMTRCAKDVDECAEHIDDCPGRSTCINTIGDYKCKCDDEYPVMIRGECQAISSCTMIGPRTSQDFVYSFNGFSNMQGFFDYDCQFIIGGICEDKYNNDTGLPYIELFILGAISADSVEPVIGGYIYDPATDSERSFATDPTLFAQKKIFYGDPLRTRDTGFVSEEINTLFAPITGNVLIIFHLDGYFKVTISFPLEVKLDLAEVYNDMRCGVCAVPPEMEGGYIVLSEEDSLSVSANPSAPCKTKEPSTTPPKTSTTTTTTTTTTVAPTTQPLESCDMAYICDALSSLCTTSKAHCVYKICEEGVDICSYLESNTFSNCAGAGVDGFLRSISCDHCDDHMHFGYVSTLTQSSCQNPYGHNYNQESANPQNVFMCVCNEGRILSGSNCIPIEECGCVSNQGIYYEKGASWNNADCSKSYYCHGFDVTEHPYGCHAEATCVAVSNEKGYVCKCNNGYFGSGNGDSPNGCTEGEVTDDGSKICTRDFQGKQECVCNQGFSSNCFECEDIDECATGFHHCDSTTQTCVNERGSHSCLCNEGFKMEAGECVPESKDRQCAANGPYGKVITLKDDENADMKCLAENKIVTSCDDLVCNGGNQGCCMPTSYEFVEVSMSCYHAHGNFSHSKTKMVAQPVSCRCGGGDPAA